MGERRSWFGSGVGESRSVLDDLTRGHVTRVKLELPGAFLRLPVLLLFLFLSISLLLINEKERKKSSCLPNPKLAGFSKANESYCLYDSGPMVGSVCKPYKRV